MTRDKKAVQTTSVAFVSVLAIGVIAVCYLTFTTQASQTSRSTTASNSTNTPGTVNGGSSSFVSGVSPDGLQLEMVLNTTSMRSHGAITGHVDVVNTLARNVTVSTLDRSQNVTAWSNYIDICPSDYIIGYAVFLGHFTAGNISSGGAPLRLVPPMIPQCPPVLAVDTVTFLPSPGAATERVVDAVPPSYQVLDQLNITTLFCNNTESNENGYSCDWASPGLVGYWNWNVPDGGSFGFTSPAAVNFPPGEYTIVAWDDWNQYVYATFGVL